MNCKRFILLLLAVFSAYGAYCSPPERVEVKLMKEGGYGPFPFRPFTGCPSTDGNDTNWGKTYSRIKNIPADWTSVKKYEVVVDIKQVVYQSYFSGDISEDFYKHLQQEWKWTPDTAALSRVPLRVQIAFVEGVDASGRTMLMVDADNDGDMAGETPFAPRDFTYPSAYEPDNIVYAAYDRLSKGRIVADTLPLNIGYNRDFKRYFHNYPQYLTGELDGEKLFVCTDQFLNMLNKQAYVMVESAMPSGEGDNPDDYISATDEYITVAGKIYKNAGYDPDKEVLVLEKMEAMPGTLYSTSKGTILPPFSGMDFVTRKPVALEDYRGKYVLVDVWSVTCGPCLQEMPAMKKLYDSLDKSKIEFIGLVYNSAAKGPALQNHIDRFGINWPQLLDGENKGLLDPYGVDTLPTLWLIGPDGTIVGKNLRGPFLEMRLQEFIVPE